MTTVLLNALNSLWQVALVALVLGAGLPALFALGIRSLNSGRTVVAAGPGGELSKASRLGRAGASVCFAILIAAVLFGFVVIVYGKQLFGV
jgi:hypothetical protein